MIKKFILFHLPPLIAMISIFLVSNIPAPSLPSSLIGKDKILHFGVYFVLGFLTNRSMQQIEKLKSKSYLFTFFIVSIFGALDEVHQSFVPFRSPEFADWLADSFGVLTFIFLINYIKKRFPKI